MCAAARPTVTVVLPFGGSDAECEAALKRLAGVQRLAGDEAILVDNRREAVDGTRDGIRIVAARGERSSYHARNVGAEAAGGEWLLFVDADCLPRASLIPTYFRDPLPPGCGIVAGGVVAVTSQESTIARYARARGHIDESWHVERDPLPAGVTANLLVRRQAWEAVGGFHEGIRSGGDVELCWRVQEAGWSFAHRPEARVEHLHPDRLGALLRKTARHAAGRVWVNRRYPEAYERPRLWRPLVRSLGGSLVWLARGRPGRSLFKLLDLAWHCANVWGWAQGDNRAIVHQGSRPSARSGRRLVYVGEALPAPPDPYLLDEASAVRDRGCGVRFEALRRSARGHPVVTRRERIDYLEDDPPADRARASIWLIARHPVRVARMLLGPRSSPTETRAGGLLALAPAARRLAGERDELLRAALGKPAVQHAMRLSQLTGVPFSVVPDGDDPGRSAVGREADLLGGPTARSASA